MIGQSEKSGIEIESEYHLTGHPVFDYDYRISIFAEKKSLVFITYFKAFWDAPDNPTVNIFSPFFYYVLMFFKELGVLGTLKKKLV